MTYQPLPPFAAVAGSRQPRIVIVGEAWGKDEEPLKQPFVGESGKELFRMLGEAFPDLEPELHAQISDLHRYGSAWVRDRQRWLEAAGIAYTNVLAFRPPDNKMENLCGKKKEVGGDHYLHPPISLGKYLLPEYLPELDRLQAELAGWQPNLVLALGNTACWALLRATNIGSIRGTVTAGHPEGAAAGRKVLPTYHPAGVMRNWSWRPIVVADLMKASRECSFSEIRRPERRVLIDPTLSEIKQWFELTIAHAKAIKDHDGMLIVAADTETESKQIKMISFSYDIGEALNIPFWNKSQPGWSHYPEHEEREIWNLIDSFMNSPLIELCWQNGIYDYQYVNPMMISVARSKHDTMLLHHSLYPELQKGLGFMGSIYTAEASWKLMRKEKQDSEKRDE